MNTRLILVGGFLGAGKTTLLAEAARRLTARGRKVGLIANDQAPNLVDTALLSRTGSDIQEVSGSCFCCNFTGFTHAAAALTAAAPTDIILAEPVGSCTDLSATILQPLKDQFAQTYTLAPFTVLADPLRLHEVLTSGKSGRLHDSAVYIFRKQLEEADLIVLNKCDLLTATAIRTLTRAVRREFPGMSVLPVSVATGAGVETWLDAVLADSAAGNRLATIDYDIYAEGEAVLGWLNALLCLTANGTTDWPAFAHTFLKHLQAELSQSHIEVGHIKILLTVENHHLIANLTRTDGKISLRGTLPNAPKQVELTINARAQTPPDNLERMIRGVLAQTTGQAIRAKIHHLRCLQPGRPQPTHRYTKLVKAKTMTPKKTACCPDTTTDCCGHATKKTCICTLSKTAGKVDIEKIRKLASNPQFICGCCGRMANKAAHVCKPVPLKPVVVPKSTQRK